MISKKNLLLVLLASFALTLGACNGKKPSSLESGKSEPGETSEPSIPSEPSEPFEPSTPSEPSEPSEPSTPSEPSEVTISSIAVKEGTVKTDYSVGEEFTVEGGKLTVKYSDYSRDEVDMTLSMVTNVPDMTIPHENYEVQVSYEGASTSYIINVVSSDARQEVSIGVSYDYNGGEAVELDLSNPVELEFTVGKSYHFYYGCYPSEAKNSLSDKYVRLGEENEDLGKEKPYSVGNYSYTVYLAEGDEAYKPTSVTINYSIIEPVTKDFLLNKDNAPELGATIGELTQDVDGISVNYKNAKAAENAVATLVKQAEAGEKANEEDNYIEIASPVLVTTELSVTFEVATDRYVRVYGSFDGEHWYLVDTLTSVKQSTTRGNDYFFFRLVNCSFGEGNVELTIQSISFKYEVDGAPATLAARAEHSDRLNHASYAEEGAYYNSDEVYDAKYSTKGIKYRNCEMHARIDIGYTIKANEAWNYKLVFKVRPSDDATYQAHNNDTTVKENVSMYARAVIGTEKRGFNRKLNTMTSSAEWLTVEYNIGELFDETFDLDGINLWINRKCTTGYVFVDDFRIVQVEDWPVPTKLSSITVSDMTTEFAKNGEFVFDGVVTAHYTDESSKVIPNDNENLTIEAPEMSTSGEKDVKVSYSEGGVTKSTTYRITITAGVDDDPKAEETMPIVSEELDLAKAENQGHDGKEGDVGVLANNTTTTYGNSTNSLEATNLPASEKYFVLNLSETVTTNRIKLKFFAKNYSHRLYLTFIDSGNSETPKRTKTDKFTTKVDAGNGWMMLEHTFDISAAVGGVSKVKFVISSNFLAANESLILDGIEVTAIQAE